MPQPIIVFRLRQGIANETWEKAQTRVKTEKTIQQERHLEWELEITVTSFKLQAANMVQKVKVNLQTLL